MDHNSWLRIKTCEHALYGMISLYLVTLARAERPPVQNKEYFGVAVADASNGRESAVIPGGL